MRVLVACEESQTVANAFREAGHEAYSCDLVECSGGHPEYHLRADALEILKIKWDMIIAHPPCTYMSKAGARWMYPKAGELSQERFDLAMKAKEFFMRFLMVDCPRICVENPRPLKVVGLPPPYTGHSTLRIWSSIQQSNAPMVERFTASSAHKHLDRTHSVSSKQYGSLFPWRRRVKRNST